MKFTPLTRRNGGCPICNSSDGRCRKLDDLILCMETQGDVEGYHYFGQSKDGLWGKYKSESGEPKRNWQPREEVKPEGVKLPAKERDTAIKSIIQQLPLHEVDRNDLIKRGLTPKQINDWGFVSISKASKLETSVSPDLAGMAIDGRHFCIAPHDYGYLIPVKDIDGNYVSFKLRVSKPKDGNKYKFLKSSKNARREHDATCHTAEFRELPLQHAIVDRAEGKPLILEEGEGKSVYTASKFNINCIGASGGNFLTSKKTLKHGLDILKPSVIILGADSGSRINAHVLRQYRALAIQLKEWGYDLFVADWGQGSDKSLPDIDELDVPEWELKPYQNWDVAYRIPANQILESKDWLTQKIYASHLAWQSARRYTPDINYNEEFCLSPVAPKEGEIVALKYHTGQGKSTLIKNWFSNELNAFGAVKLGSRNSLEIQFASTSDFYHLKEDDGEQLIKDPKGRLTCCIDSILKFKDDDFDDKILVLDEIESVARHTLNGGTLKERQQQVIDQLKMASQRCHSIILADGNLTDATCNWIQKISEKKLIKYYNKRIPKRPQCFLYDDVGKNFKKIINQIKSEKFPWVMFDSQIDCEAADLDLTRYGRKVLRIDSKTINDPTKGKEIKEFLAHPDLFLKNAYLEYDCIISSPTVESGLDCNFKGFSGVYLLAKHLEINTLIQMIIRVRDVETPRHICCAEFVGHTDDDTTIKSPFIKTFEQMAIDLQRQSIEALGPELGMEETAIRAALHKLLDIAMNSPEQKLFETYQSIRNYERANLRNCLIESLQNSGYEIEIVEAGKPFLTQFKEAKKEVKINRAQEITDAKAIDDNQFKILSKRQDLKWEDRCSVLKYRLMEQLPGVEPDWEQGLVYHLLFENKKLIHQAEIRWILNHPDLAIKRSEKAWHNVAKHNRTFLGNFKTLLPLIKELNRLGVPELMEHLTKSHYNNNTPEVRELWKRWGRVQVTRTGIERGTSPVRLIKRLAAKLGYESDQMGVKKINGTTHKDYILNDLLADGYGVIVANCIDERLSDENLEPRLTDEDWLQILQSETIEISHRGGSSGYKSHSSYINTNKAVCNRQNSDAVIVTAIPDVKKIEFLNLEPESVQTIGEKFGSVQPSVEEVASFLRHALLRKNGKLAYQIAQMFGGGEDSLMAQAVLKYEELIAIYDLQW